MVINGLFEGNCYANTVDILSNGKAHGSMHTDDLCIERGGSFLGHTQPTADEKVISLASTAKLDKADPSLLDNEKPATKSKL